MTCYPRYTTIMPCEEWDIDIVYSWAKTGMATTQGKKYIIYQNKFFKIVYNKNISENLLYIYNVKYKLLFAKSD